MGVNAILQAVINTASITNHNEQDLQNLSKSIADRLKNLAQEFHKPSSDSLWQEIKSLPELSKDLCDKHIINAFQKASEEINSASKNPTVRGLACALLNAACTICKGFYNFFAELAEKSPKLYAISVTAVKLAFVVAICVIAPYLSPLAAAIVININNYVEQNATNHKKDEKSTNKNQSIVEEKNLQKTSQEVQNTYNDLLKDNQELKDVPYLVEKIIQIAQKYHIPAEKIATLRLDKTQLARIAASEQKEFHFISALAEAKALIPGNNQAGIYYANLVKADLITKLDKCLEKHTLEQRQELFALFEKITTPAFHAMENISYDKNLFHSAAQMAKISEEHFKPSLEEFIQACESSLLRQKITIACLQVRDERLTQPLKPIINNIKSAKTQLEQLGMTPADYDILKLYSQHKTSASMNKAHQEQSKENKLHPRINNNLSNSTSRYK
jgi:hypothetical protein